MDWRAGVDAYCERTSPEFWAEPVNAVTNAAFLAAAILMWRRAPLPMARALSAVLGLIGVGSFLFHTFAERWAGLADVLPILAFILLYIFAANRDFLGLSPVRSFLGVLAFFPYAALAVPLFARLGFLGSSAGYAPIPVLILVYAAFLRPRAREAARGMAMGALLLIVSLTFRTLDGPLCATVPMGTHFMWHILNAVMLAWMIETYSRHMLAGRRHSA